MNTLEEKSFIYIYFLLIHSIPILGVLFLNYDLEQIILLYVIEGIVLALVSAFMLGRLFRKIGFFKILSAIFFLLTTVLVLTISFLFTIMNILGGNLSADYNSNILPALKEVFALTSSQLAIIGFLIGNILKNRKNASTIESKKPKDQLDTILANAFKFIAVLFITIFIIGLIGQLIDLHPIIVLVLIIFFDTHIELKPIDKNANQK